MASGGNPGNGTNCVIEVPAGMGGEAAVPSIDESVRHVRSPQLREELAAIRLEPLSRLQRRLDGQITNRNSSRNLAVDVTIRGSGAEVCLTLIS